MQDKTRDTQQFTSTVWYSHSSVSTAGLSVHKKTIITDHLAAMADRINEFASKFVHS